MLESQHAESEGIHGQVVATEHSFSPDRNFRLTKVRTLRHSDVPSPSGALLMPRAISPPIAEFGSLQFRWLAAVGWVGAAAASSTTS